MFILSNNMYNFQYVHKYLHILSNITAVCYIYILLTIYYFQHSRYLYYKFKTLHFPAAKPQTIIDAVYLYYVYDYHLNYNYMNYLLLI